VTTGRSNKSAFIAKNATRGRQSGGCISSSYCRAATDGSYSQPASQLMVVATTAAATATATAVAIAIAMQQAVQRGMRYIVSNGKSGNRRQSKCFFFPTKPQSSCGEGEKSKHPHQSDAGSMFVVQSQWRLHGQQRLQRIEWWLRTATVIGR